MINLKDIEAKWKLKWDYKGLLNVPPDMDITQKDWNQTLITKVNQISAQINMSSLLGLADTIQTHSKYFPIFSNFVYYDSETNKISNRYDIVVDDSTPDNMVYIYALHIFNKNVEDDDYPKDYTLDKAKGSIEIINYG
jgi:hypothetical protein